MQQQRPPKEDRQRALENLYSSIEQILEYVLQMGYPTGLSNLEYMVQNLKDLEMKLKAEKTYGLTFDNKLLPSINALQDSLTDFISHMVAKYTNMSIMMPCALVDAFGNNDSDLDISNNYGLKARVYSASKQLLNDLSVLIKS